MTTYFRNLIIFIAAVTVLSCSKEDNQSTYIPFQYNVFQNQTDNSDADALQLHYANPMNGSQLNFYGVFDTDKNPTTVHTITYQKANNDTIVHLTLNPITSKVNSIFTTVNGIKLDVVMKFDYLSDTDLNVSFHQYNWTNNSSQLIYATNLIVNPPANRSVLMRNGVDGYNIAAVGAALAIVETVSTISGGWTLIGALSAAGATAVAAASGVALAAAAIIGAAILFTDMAGASTLPSDLPPPTNIPYQNPMLPANDPAQNLPPSTCNAIAFEGSMDSQGSIMIFGVNGGTSPYTYMVDNRIQSGEVFSYDYPNGSYLLGVKDAGGCMSVKLVPLDRELDDLHGTWKLVGSYNEDLNSDLFALSPCMAYNTMVFNSSSSSFTSSYFKLFNNGCQLESEPSGTYSLSNQILTLSQNAIGEQQTYEVIQLTDTTLKLRWSDNHGTYLDTYTKQ